jgi:hypothetical protein
MTGADIIADMLRGDTAIVVKVPAPQIKLGRLPDGTPLPALLVRVVSLTDRQPLKRGDVIRSRARVSVAVRAENYRDQVAIIKLVRKCCAGRTGDFGNARRVSILTAGLGPDVNGPGNTFEQTQDFRVSFDAQE